VRRSKVAFTIRSLMTAVALVALNLAGPIATWNRVPAKPAKRPQVPLISGGPTVFGHGVVHPKIRSDLGVLETGERLVRVVNWSPPSTLAEIWSPVVASLSITLLVFLVPSLPPTVANRSTATIVAGDPPSIRSQAWLAARCLTILAALISLNFAGAVHRPLLEPSKQPPSPLLFFDLNTFLDEEGNFIHNHLDETLEIIMANGAPRPPTLDDCRAPLQDGDARGRVRGSGVNKTLGAIVAYEVRPGLMRLVLVRPSRIKSWARSFLEVWCLAIVSALTSFLVIVVMWRQALRRRSGRVTES
jgi:hypothetical protein